MLVVLQLGPKISNVTWNILSNPEHPRSFLIMLSKKQYTFIFVLVLLSFSLVGFVFAQASGAPQKDTYVNLNAPDTAYSTESNLWATMSGDAGGNCTTTRQIFMEWDLSSITDPSKINSASLTLTVQTFVGSGSNYEVELFESNDAADLNAITWNTKPATGNSIEKQPTSASEDSTVVFSSSALVDYLKNEAAGDGKATFMIQLSPLGSCSGANTQVFYSNEDSDGRVPDLQILDANAVTLSSFSANDGQPNWPLIAGLLALVAVAVAGATYVLRRSKQS
jgi:hypothetical protein